VAEEPLLQDGILPIPEGQRETEVLFVIGDARDAVLAPAVSARAGLVVGKEIPGVTAFAIVLAHRSPLSLTEVGPPLLPVGRALAGLLQARLFLCHDGLPIVNGHTLPALSLTHPSPRVTVNKYRSQASRTEHKEKRLVQTGAAAKSQCEWLIVSNHWLITNENRRLYSEPRL
jgi:hypothetical protein